MTIMIKRSRDVANGRKALRRTRGYKVIGINHHIALAGPDVKNMALQERTRETHIKRQSPRTIHLLITIDAHKRVSPLIEGSFKTDNYELKRVRRL